MGMKMANQFDLEQGIMSCWHVTDDLDVLFEELVENQNFTKDQASNFVLGLSTIYQAKFDKLFRDFESFLKTYYKTIEQYNRDMNHMQAELEEFQNEKYATAQEGKTLEELFLEEEQESYNRLMDEYDIIDLVEDEGSIF